MTSKDLSIFNSLRPFSIGFDDMFDQFENMLGNGSLTMQSNYPPYNIRKTGKDNYAIEVALAGFNKNDVEVEFEDNLLTVSTKQVNKSENNSADGEIIMKRGNIIGLIKRIEAQSNSNNAINNLYLLIAFIRLFKSVYFFVSFMPFLRFHRECSSWSGFKSS